MANQVKEDSRLVALILAAAFIGILTQRTADSGAIFTSKLALAAVISIASYLAVFALIKLKKNSLSYWMSTFAITITGTFLNLVMKTAIDAYSDYLTERANGILDTSTFYPFQIQQFLLRIAVLLPLLSLIFIVVFSSLHFVTKRAVKRIGTN